MAASLDRDQLTLAIGQRVPDFVRTNVPEALSGVSSRSITRVPPTAVVLVMAHPGTCLLEEAAADAGYVCLRVFDPRMPVADLESRADDLVSIGAPRDEILWRALRALRLKLPYEAPELPELHADGISLGERFVPLSASEVRVVQRLMDEAGRPVAPQALARALGHADVERRAIEAHLYRLRQKLRPLAGVEIQTVRQRGYRWHVRGAEDPRPQAADSVVPRFR